MELDGCSSNANPHRNNSSGGSRHAGTENLTEKELCETQGVYFLMSLVVLRKISWKLHLLPQRWQIKVISHMLKSTINI